MLNIFKSVILIAGLLIFSVVAKAQNDWENEQVIKINKELAHATFNYSENQKESLNGTWNFALYKNRKKFLKI